MYRIEYTINHSNEFKLTNFLRLFKKQVRHVSIKHKWIPSLQHFSIIYEISLYQTCKLLEFAPTSIPFSNESVSLKRSPF